MNAKQNFLEAISFGSPERVPHYAPTRWVTYLGANHEGYDGRHEGEHPLHEPWKDIWRTGWVREQEGVMGFMTEYPLADLPSALAGYDWPDPDDERLIGRLGEQAAQWEPEEQLLCCSHRDTLWEKSYMLVGMEDLMCYMLTDPDAVKEMMHRIMDFQLGIAEHYISQGVEMACLGDDLGTQRGLLLSPDIIQEFLVPEYRRLFNFYRERGVLLEFHSCGHIIPVLEMFMDLGVNVLNPIQCTANDLDQVRAVTQGRMALKGGVSSAIVVDGPSERIAAEVRKRMWQLGREGGYVCTPDQGMAWPEEHIRAFRDAVEEYGAYPLSEPQD